jgi:hypothetical protein
MQGIDHFMFLHFRAKSKQIFNFIVHLLGKHLSNTFPIKNCLKQGDALSPLLLKFSLECTIRRVQANQEGLKLNDTHPLQFYADDFNVLGGKIHTMKENKEALVIVSKEMVL